MQTRRTKEVKEYSWKYFYLTSVAIEIETGKDSKTFMDFHQPIRASTGFVREQHQAQQRKGLEEKKREAIIIIIRRTRIRTTKKKGGLGDDKHALSTRRGTENNEKNAGAEFCTRSYGKRRGGCAAFTWRQVVQI